MPARLTFIGLAIVFAAATVLFLSTAVPALAVDNHIDAVAPAHAAGTVDVRVTTPNGTSVENPNDVYHVRRLVGRHHGSVGSALRRSRRPLQPLDQVALVMTVE